MFDWPSAISLCSVLYLLNSSILGRVFLLMKLASCAANYWCTEKPSWSLEFFSSEDWFGSN